VGVGVAVGVAEAVGVGDGVGPAMTLFAHRTMTPTEAMASSSRIVAITERELAMDRLQLKGFAMQRKMIGNCRTIGRSLSRSRH